MNGFGQPPGALRQACAEPLTPRGHLHQLQHAAPFAPAERHTDVRWLEPAPLERLADEGQRDAHRDRVHPEQVAEVVGQDQRFRIGDAEHGTEREDRLVLRHLGPGARELAFRDRVLLAARHRALQTGGVAVVVVLLQRLAADRSGLGEDLALEVVAAERAQRVDRADEKRRAEGGQRLRAGAQRLARLLEQRLERSRIGDRGLARAPHHQRLDVLAAEHRADPTSPRHALAILPEVGHGGEAHALLAGRADGDGVRVPALDLEQRIHRLPRRAPPQMGGRLQLRAVLVDAHVGRRRRAAGEDDGVEAGALERGREAAPEGGVEEETGERRLGRHARPAVAGDGRVGDGPDREDDGIGGIEGVDAGGNVVEQHARGQAVAAEQRARRALGQGLDARGAGRAVDEEQTAAVALHGPAILTRCYRGRAARPWRAETARSEGRSLWARSLR